MEVGVGLVELVAVFVEIRKSRCVASNVSLLVKAAVAVFVRHVYSKLIQTVFSRLRKRLPPL
jgi:hypothetical protein